MTIASVPQFSFFPYHTITDKEGIKLKEEVLLQERNTDHSQSMEIDLAELFFFILSKWYLVLLGIMIGGFIMGYMAYIKVPTYSSTAKLYILGDSNNLNGNQNDYQGKNGNNMTDFQIGAELTNDYQEVFKAWEVHNMVNEMLGTKYEFNDLQKMLSVTNPDDTRMLYITITNEDPKLAADIANAYAVSAQHFIATAFDTEKPIKFSTAIVSETPLNQDFIKSVLIGAAGGAVLIIGLLCLICILDNKPKSADDITKYCGIPLLAVIPKDTHMAGYKKAKSGKARSRR